MSFNDQIRETNPHLQNPNNLRNSPRRFATLESKRAKRLNSSATLLEIPNLVFTKCWHRRIENKENVKLTQTNRVIDICWYFNGKLVKSHPSIKIRLQDGFTSCTFLEAEQEMAGEYMVKATSNAGAHQTKAHLHVHGRLLILLGFFMTLLNGAGYNLSKC